jgi:hypothetical protein
MHSVAGHSEPESRETSRHPEGGSLNSYYAGCPPAKGRIRQTKSRPEAATSPTIRPQDVVHPLFGYQRTERLAVN